MKSTLLSFVLAIFSLALFSPSPVLALDLRTGSDIRIDSEELISNNLYVAGGNSKLSATIDGDVSLISSNTTIEGLIEKDITIAGGQVNINGEIKGDLRIVGGDVFIRGKILGDTVVVAGNINLENGAQIEGELLVVGGKININSEIKNYGKIVGGHVVLNNKITGSMDITTQQLVLGEKAQIDGVIRYFSPVKLQQSLSTTINSEIIYNQISSITDSNIFKKVVLSFINFWILLRFITTLLLAFLMVYIFKVFSQKVNDYGIDNFGKSLLIGILSIIFTPVVITILFVSLIGFPIAILLGISLVFIFIISSAIAGIIMGSLIHRVIKKSDNLEINFQNTAVGVILLTVLQFVPVVGELTRLVFFIVAIGSVIHYVYQSIRFKKLF